MRTLALLALTGCIHIGCVVEGTLIATPDGARPVEELEVGDAVLDGHVAAVVRHDARRHLQLALSDGSTLGVTRTHPLKSGTGWRDAGDVRVGDRLRGRRGWLRVERVETRGPARVYDLTVSPHHEFYAGSVLAHNKTILPPPRPDEIPGTWICASDGTVYNRLVLHPDGTGTWVQVLGEPEVIDVTWKLFNYEFTLRCVPRGRKLYELKGSVRPDQLRLDDDRYRFMREERWHAMERLARRSE